MRIILRAPWWSLLSPLLWKWSLQESCELLYHFGKLPAFMTLYKAFVSSVLCQTLCVCQHPGVLHAMLFLLFVLFAAGSFHIPSFPSARDSI